MTYGCSPHPGEIILMLFLLVMSGHLISSFAVLEHGEIPVSSFSGEDIYVAFPANTTNLRFSIMPGNATVFWLKCYHGNRQNEQTFFYGYDHSSGRYKQEKELGKRTHHLLQRGEVLLYFSLIISRPVLSDLGRYICLLHSANNPEESLQWQASIELKRNTPPSELRTNTSGTGKNWTTTDKGSIHLGIEHIVGIVLGTLFFVSLVVVTVVIYKRRQQYLPWSKIEEATEISVGSVDTCRSPNGTPERPSCTRSYKLQGKTITT